ncbi:hypothetical protein Tco_1419863 [Tanacetum coccineum]
MKPFKVEDKFALPSDVKRTRIVKEMILRLQVHMKSFEIFTLSLACGIAFVHYAQIALMIKKLLINKDKLIEIKRHNDMLIARGNYQQKEEVTDIISDPVARRRACFTSNLKNFRIIHQGRVIHSPQIASVGAISHIFPNNNLEDSFKMGDEDLNFIPNKELDKEDLISIPRESKIGKECDFPLCDDFQSFKTFSNPFFEKKDGFPSRNDESILKEEVHKETFKSYLNPLFEDDEEIISIEVSRQISPKVNSEPSIESPISSSPSLSSSEASEYSLDEFDNDDDLFEMDSNNDEWKIILYGEDFERMDSDSDKTKDFDKSSSSVFKSLSDEFEPGGSSYVEGNDLVCYEGFS